MKKLIGLLAIVMVGLSISTESRAIEYRPYVGIGSEIPRARDVEKLQRENLIDTSYGVGANAGLRVGVDSTNIEYGIDLCLGKNTAYIWIPEGKGIGLPGADEVGITERDFGFYIGRTFSTEKLWITLYPLLSYSFDGNNKLANASDVVSGKGLSLGYLNLQNKNDFWHMFFEVKLKYYSQLSSAKSFSFNSNELSYLELFVGIEF